MLDSSNWVLVRCGGKELLVQFGNVGEVACLTVATLPMKFVQVYRKLIFHLTKKKTLHLLLKDQRITVVYEINWDPEERIRCSG